MSKLVSRENRRRWRTREYREKVIPRIREGVRRSYLPKVKVGTTPQCKFPQSINNLLDTFGDEALEVINVQPVRVDRRTCYAVTVIDGTDIALAERYSLYVRENGLDLFRIFPKPLPHGDGLSVVLFVGVPEGV